jgi:predicted DNA-binding transcriptional regulator AlpA
MSTSIPSPGTVAVSSGPGSTVSGPREMPRVLRRQRPGINVSKRRNAVGGDRPLQLPLVLVVPPVSSPKIAPAASPKRLPIIDRFVGMDARMSTSDVVRVVGVNRSTLFRWCKKGLFPPKHISGGWLRSDVEKWFAAKAIQDS